MRPAAHDQDKNDAAREAAAVFFERVQEAFRTAEKAAGGAVNRGFTIGGDAVQIKFAGDALVPLLTPALEHLAAPAGFDEPDLIVYAWESETTHTGLPRRP